ncbi:amidohydrolase family protein [Aquabacterium sp.]|uniref:amidohydrolase family protein n=1 Tax=Aquabacterium sp. TaxID=1872578 RepID=UPI003D6DA51D
MNQQRILIRGGHLLTMDERLGEIHCADILIDSGRIQDIAPNIEVDDALIIDGSDAIVLPGFVDAHRHMWQTQMRARMGNGTLLDYGAEIRSVFSACYDPDDVYIGILMGYLDALHAGCTTLIDHCHIMNSLEHSEQAVLAFKDSMARGVFGYGFFPNPEMHKPDDLQRLFSPADRMAHEARAIRVKHFSDSGRIRFGTALTELEWFPIEHTLRELKLARVLGSHKISIHAGLGSSSQHTRFVERLAKSNALAPDLHFVHGWGLSDKELRLLSDAGSSVVATPETEMQMAMGFPVVGRFRREGGRAALGIDIVSNNSADMFTQMRLALQTVRGLENASLARKGLFPDQLSWSTSDILRAATIDGARALNLDAEVGSLSVGKRADIQMIRKSDINMVPVLNATNAVVLSANVSNIDTVMVDGDIVKREGRMVHDDLPLLIQRLKASSSRIHERAESFDFPAIRSTVRTLFPVSFKESMEQRFAAAVFNSSSHRLHEWLMKIIMRKVNSPRTRDSRAGAPPPGS